MPPKNSKPKERYQKMDQITHVLSRSEMYVGSLNLKNINEYIATKNEDGYHIHQEDITSSPAILRIFVEPLSNALDNAERSKKTKTSCWCW